MPVLDRGEHQRVLGVEGTSGDARALTNMVLRRWTSIYDAEAEAWTDAPDRYSKFYRQQLRWKKSWVRESPILVTHLWRTHPIAFPAVLVATLSGLASPIVAIYNLVWVPLAQGISPVFYVLCLYLLSMAYALMYRALRADGIWRYCIAATFFYISFAPQLFWAILRIRDGRWGTRPAAPTPAGDELPEPHLDSLTDGVDPELAPASA